MKPEWEHSICGQIPGAGWWASLAFRIWQHEGIESCQLSIVPLQFSSVQFSHSVVSYSLRPHELVHARPPCPLFCLYSLMVSHLYRWRAHLVNFSAEAPHSWSNFHINDIKSLPSVTNWTCGRNLLEWYFSSSFSSFHSFCLACVGSRLNQNYLKISYKSIQSKYKTGNNKYKNWN